MCLLMICEILGLFVNTLTADHKYCLRNNEDLQQSIQMQLSKKQKAFSELFAGIQRSRLNFEHFEKKYDVHIYFRNYKLQNTWLGKCLKTAFHNTLWQSAC